MGQDASDSTPRGPVVNQAITFSTVRDAPTIGLLPVPIRPIISTCGGTEDEPATRASEWIGRAYPSTRIKPARRRCCRDATSPSRTSSGASCGPRNPATKANVTRTASAGSLAAQAEICIPAALPDLPQRRPFVHTLAPAGDWSTRATFPDFERQEMP